MKSETVYIDDKVLDALLDLYGFNENKEEEAKIKIGYLSSTIFIGDKKIHMVIRNRNELEMCLFSINHKGSLTMTDNIYVIYNEDEDKTELKFFLKGVVRRSFDGKMFNVDSELILREFGV